MGRIDYAGLYEQFDAPVTAFDCGERCAPYNDRGAPFCCDSMHAVPTAYQAEFRYLQEKTDLWKPWQARTPSDATNLQRQLPEGHVLIACKGHLLCQRNFRSITCRAFPFFPYLSRQGNFLGMTYYWEYADRCWVISHLNTVTLEYRRQFVAAFEALFLAYPEERENFRQFSGIMRRVFGRRKQAIPLLHRNGGVYKVTSRNGRLRRTDVDRLPAYGVYKIAAELPFPGEENLI